VAGVAGVEVRFAATRSGHAGHASPSPRPDSFAAWVRAALRGMKDAPRDERGMKPDPALWIKFPASRLPGKISSGGERTRTADFHVANVALYQLSYTPVAIAPGQGTRSAPRHEGRPRRSGFHDSASAGGPTSAPGTSAMTNSQHDQPGHPTTRPDHPSTIQPSAGDLFDGVLGAVGDGQPRLLLELRRH
jgi:hypothetical protein